MAGALQGFVGLHSTDVVLLNAGALLIMAPVIVVFLIFQKYFTKALLAGAVKG
jgi:raffinose/stachyose/melibiose transport system permease protein